MVFSNDNIKYVDMAIYIDSHIYEKNFDEEKIYLYLCDLVYMLASKKRFFNNKKDLTNLFSIKKILMSGNRSSSAKRKRTTNNRSINYKSMF